MKTLIFKSDKENTSGFIEYRKSDGEISISYSIRANPPDCGFLKLYALSSKKPFNTPVIADTPEFKSQTATGTKTLRGAYLLENGFEINDIDTFALVKTDKNRFADSVEAVCFASYEWDASKAFKNNIIIQSENPVTRGERLLREIKNRTVTTDPQIQKIWLSHLEDAVCKMKKSDILPASGYRWYISESMKAPLPLSAYRHLLFVTEVMTVFDREGFYLFGMRNDGHTALSIKAGEFNPFINANDCAVKTGDFYTVGIYLAPDGQYFEKPLT